MGKTSIRKHPGIYNVPNVLGLETAFSKETPMDGNLHLLDPENLWKSSSSCHFKWEEIGETPPRQHDVNPLSTPASGPRGPRAVFGWSKLCPMSIPCTYYVPHRTTTCTTLYIHICVPNEVPTIQGPNVCPTFWVFSTVPTRLDSFPGTRARSKSDRARSAARSQRPFGRS